MKSSVDIGLMQLSERVVGWLELDQFRNVWLPLWWTWVLSILDEFVPSQVLEALLEEVASIFVIKLVEEELHELLQLDVLNIFDIICIVDIGKFFDGWCELEVDKSLDSLQDASWCDILLLGLAS